MAVVLLLGIKDGGSRKIALHMSPVSELEHLSPFLFQSGLSALWVDPRVLHS